MATGVLSLYHADHKVGEGQQIVVRARYSDGRSEDVTRWVFSEDSVGIVEWEDRLREWVRSELVPGTELPS